MEEKVKQERIRLEEEIRMSRQQNVASHQQHASSKNQHQSHGQHQHQSHESYGHQLQSHESYGHQHQSHESYHQQHQSHESHALHESHGHHQTSTSVADLITPVIQERATASMRVSPPKNNFDVLIRVLEEPDYLGGGTADDDDVSSVHSVLTEEERFRLREVIMTDERIQTILKETHTTEKMLM